MNKPTCLDICCCAGGMTRGYQLAGFHVTGVDIEPQPRYCGDVFIKADGLEYLAAHGHEYDFISCSPPCQEYSNTRTMHSNVYPKLIAPFRELLIASGKPYVLENVPGARKHMRDPMMLCGTMFGLGVIRHRLFETNPKLYFAPASCCHNGRTAKRGEYDRGQGGFITVAGHNFNLKVASAAMGIDWMNHDEIAEAIPPAYARWLGAQMMAYVLEVSR